LLAACFSKLNQKLPDPRLVACWALLVFILRSL